MGIGLTNVLFFSDTVDNQTVFKFNDALFSAIAFWTLGDGAGIHVNDSQGCVQMVGDKLNFQDIRYSRCGFSVIPAPSTLVGLISMGAMGLWTLLRRRRRAR